MGQNDPVMLELHTEQAAGKLFQDGARNFDTVLFAHTPLNCGSGPVAGDPEGIPNLRPIDFEFYRFRFHFQAREALDFPPGGSANLVRGAFGALLRKIAPTELYTRLFEPGKGGGHGPSGLAEWPRP